MPPNSDARSDTPRARQIKYEALVSQAIEQGRFWDMVWAELARDYNAAIQRVPAVFFAGVFGFRSKAYFQAAPGAEKPPPVQFDFSGKPAPAKP